MVLDPLGLTGERSINSAPASETDTSKPKKSARRVFIRASKDVTSAEKAAAVEALLRRIKGAKDREYDREHGE